MIGFMKFYGIIIFEVAMLLLSSKQGIFIRVIGYFERVQGESFCFCRLLNYFSQSLKVEEACFYRIFHKVRDCMNIEFLHNIFSVGFHSLDTDEKFVCNLLVCET